MPVPSRALGPLRPAAVDLVVAGSAAVPTTLDAWVNEAGTRQADALTYALVAAPLVALLGRRRWPRAVAVACGVGVTTLYLLGHHGELLNLPTLIALYTVAVQGDRSRTLRVAAVAVGWATLVVVATRGDAPPGTTWPGAEPLWPLVALLVGEYVRNRRELLDEYAARTARAEADREREADRRVQRERVRIARDLHDVVAHTVTAMNVHAGLAVEAFDVRPEVARQALDQVRTSGRTALTELHATVAVLRAEPTDDPAAAPMPRLAQLDHLVAHTRRAGVSVTVAVDLGDTTPAAVVELTAYRLVQEALTNVIRHAGAGVRDVRAGVDVHATGDVLVVEVLDDGGGGAPDGAAVARPAPPSGDEPVTPGAADDREDREHRDGRAGVGGYGLTGMDERAAAVGGSVHHGPRPGGGFRVRAVLPLNGRASTDAPPASPGQEPT